MNHYVYRTARGLLRTVQADDGCAAWRLAEQRHAVAEVHDLTGATWRYSGAIPGPHRDDGVYITPEHAQALYLDACAAELSPGAREHLRAGCLWTPSEGRALHQRGLIVSTGPRSPLTDLGQAFVAWTGGA